MSTPLHTLYTLGYTGAKLNDIQAWLESNNAILVDTRYSPLSRVTTWQGDNLKKVIGSRYIHMRSLGNKNYKLQFGEGIMIVDMEKGTSDLLNILKSQPVVLMCACENYHTCHRTTTADEMAKRYGVKVVHLVLSDLKPTPPSKSEQDKFPF